MVDIKCRFPKAKYRKEENSAFSSEGPNDETLLRQPMSTSCAGFREAKKAYENGTDEVRRLLMRECSLIYECNICRNLFRSLANFISHKRNYCKSAATENLHSYSDHSSNVLIQTVERFEPSLIKSRSTGSSPIPNTKSSNRDLSKVIERLKRVEVSSGSCNARAMVVECNKKARFPEPNAPDPVLELERVSTTTRAVYQTLKMKNDVHSIKTELDEVNNILTNQKILLGPDGKAIPFTSSTQSNGNETAQISPAISCEICKMKFQTEKTLKMHVQKNHTSATYVFQCPSCSMTFLQPAAVIRHLGNEHKKPLRKIRKMRDAILKKRIKIGDVEAKSLSWETKRFQMTNTKDFDNSNTSDQQTGRPITSCMHCFKVFERRASLVTHLANCMARKSSFNDAERSIKETARNEQNNEAKIQNQISNPASECSNLKSKVLNGNRELDEVNIKLEPKEDLNSPTNSSNINEMFENLENQTFGNGLHTVSLEKIEMMEEFKERRDERQEKTKNDDNKEYEYWKDASSEKKIKENNTTNKYKPVQKQKSKCFRVVSASKQLTCRCKICNKQFNALSNLRRHISMFHYRSRRFGCKLCDYRAFRRYDIVNHLTFVHKMTGERESMAVEYVTVHEIKYSKDDVDGDIVVVNDESNVSEKCNTNEKHQVAKDPQKSMLSIALNTNEEEKKSEKEQLQSDKDILQPFKIDLVAARDRSHGKVVRRKFKKSLEQHVESEKRPIRNRIKTVNKDFIYDPLTIKDEPKKASRSALKRGNVIVADQNNLINLEFTPPPIKIIPYRLRTEPLMPSDKCSVRGIASSVCRNLILEGMAAPSTLPELPAERPQMRTRLISSSRSDSNTVPIIETSELEAAGLKSTFFDDSFLEKFAKKSNPSFKMKPLLALHHSPLNSILQKCDASQRSSNIKRVENTGFLKPPEEDKSAEYALCILQSLTQPILKENDVTPNGKQILDQSLPPAVPKKRITLMQRLADNRARAKRKNSIICTAVEN